MSGEDKIKRMDSLFWKKKNSYERNFFQSAL